MPGYRGLLLDFYGTLVFEDDDVVADIAATIAQHASSPVSSREVSRFWWETFSPLFQTAHDTQFALQRDLARQSLGETIRHFGATLDPNTLITAQFAHWGAPPIYSDTRPFLSYLKHTHLPVCIVSNIDRADLEQAITFHDLHFDHIVTSDDVRSYKPRPEIFKAALEELGLGVDDVLHVGDSRTSDIAGAQGLGIRVVWLNRTGKAPTGGPQPDHTVRDLDELQGILDTLG